jgi:hypothetical protein
MERVLTVPKDLARIRYDGARIPETIGASDVTNGANCQLYAYAFLARHGKLVPPFRSSELWADRVQTVLVRNELEPLDLLLYHSHPQPWGAHLAVYLGGERAVHLCKEVGRPVVWELPRFLQRSRYACFIGAKRVL